jgi:hypothetical protein
MTQHRRNAIPWKTHFSASHLPGVHTRTVPLQCLPEPSLWFDAPAHHIFKVEVHHVVMPTTEWKLTLWLL